MAQPADNSDALYSVSGTRARRRAALENQFGGIAWGADFLGFAVATFFTVVLFGIVGAIVGTVGYQMGAPVPNVGSHLTSTTANLGIAGLVGGLIALFVAYFLGGYAAGRMARFSGPAQGIGVVIWTIVVALILGAIGAVLGNRFNVASQLNLHINGSALTTAGVISLIVTLIVMIIGAILGGMAGVAYHRSIDRAVEQMS